MKLIKRIIKFFKRKKERKILELSALKPVIFTTYKYNDLDTIKEI